MVTPLVLWIVVPFTVGGGLSTDVPEKLHGVRIFDVPFWVAIYATSTIGVLVFAACCIKERSLAAGYCVGQIVSLALTMCCWISGANPQEL